MKQPTIFAAGRLSVSYSWDSDEEDAVPESSDEAIPNKAIINLLQMLSHTWFGSQEWSETQITPTSRRKPLRVILVLVKHQNRWDRHFRIG